MKNPLEAYFKNCLYFTSGKLYRQVEKMAFGAFKPLGIAPSHAFILMAIDESPKKESTPSQLADILTLDKSTITRLLKQLESLELISRQKDGKHVHLRLTTKGKALIPGVEKSWHEFYLAYGKFWGKTKSDDINKKIFDFLNGK